MTTRIIQHTWTASDRLSDNSPLWEYINNEVDLTFADPPYNFGADYDSDDGQDNLEPEEYQYWVEQVIRKLVTMTRAGGMLFWLCPARDGDWTWRALRRYGRLLHGQPIIWYERFSQYQTKKLTSDYRLLFPLIVHASSRCMYKPTFNPNDIREESVRQQMGDKRANPRGRVPGHVWTVSRLQGNATARVDWHPAQLPPAPLARIVQGWTNMGDTVLDAFAGSGSMGVVCQGLGRNFVGVEQSALYCDKIKQRIEGTDDTD